MGKPSGSISGTCEDVEEDGTEVNCIVGSAYVNRNKGEARWSLEKNLFDDDNDNILWTEVCNCVADVLELVEGDSEKRLSRGKLSRFRI